MTTRRLTARERIADWTLAYHVMLEEMTASMPPDTFIADFGEASPEAIDRQRLVLMKPGSTTFIEGYRVQDRRAAAFAAAILVSSAGPSAERAVAVSEDSDDE